MTAFVASGSTGGTISGISRFLKEQNPDVTSVLLDPVGSIYHRYFHDGVVDPTEIAPYFVEGVGEDHLAECMDFSLIDDVMRFSDADAFATCHHLARREGLVCGGTAGANVWGAVRVARSLEGPAVVVTVLPDSGSKYMSKIYNPNWLKETDSAPGTPPNGKALCNGKHAEECHRRTDGCPPVGFRLRGPGRGATRE